MGRNFYGISRGGQAKIQKIPFKHLRNDYDWTAVCYMIVSIKIRFFNFYYLFVLKTIKGKKN